MSNTNAPTVGGQGTAIAGTVSAASVIDPAKRAAAEAGVRAALGGKYDEGEAVVSEPAPKAKLKPSGKKGVPSTPVAPVKAPVTAAYAPPKPGDAVPAAAPQGLAPARPGTISLGTGTTPFKDLDPVTLDIVTKIYCAALAASPGAFSASIQPNWAQSALRHALNIQQAMKRHPGFNGLNVNSVF